MSSSEGSSPAAWLLRTASEIDVCIPHSADRCPSRLGESINLLIAVRGTFKVMEIRLTDVVHKPGLRVEVAVAALVHAVEVVFVKRPFVGPFG